MKISSSPKKSCKLSTCNDETTQLRNNSLRACTAAGNRSHMTKAPETQRNDVRVGFGKVIWKKSDGRTRLFSIKPESNTWETSRNISEHQRNNVVNLSTRHKFQRTSFLMQLLSSSCFCFKHLYRKLKQQHKLRSLAPHASAQAEHLLHKPETTRSTTSNHCFVSA